MQRHEILGGKVQIYRRAEGGSWHCSASVGNKQHRSTTKTEKTFKDAATQFTREYAVITEGQRSVRWTEGHAIRLRIHLLPFFGEMGLSEITAGTVQEYRVHRMSSKGVVNPHSLSNRSVNRQGAGRQNHPQ